MRTSKHAVNSIVLLLLLATPTVGADSLPLLYSDNFEDGMAHWQTSDPNPAKLSWKIVELKGANGKPTKAFRALGTSTLQPAHRSPPNYALLKDHALGDFELTAKVQSTNVNAGAHRDMCIFWGYQDKNHYYYVHFGAKADPHACQIFVVNDADRKAITKKEAKGTPWTEGWHTVKVIRRVGDGTMEVYFDDMEKPFMTAADNTFKWGRVGLGTFDDNGNWDDFELRGVKIEKEELAKLKEETREARGQAPKEEAPQETNKE